MALRWIEGFDTFGDTGTTAAQLDSLLGAKYNACSLDDSPGAQLIAGYNGSGYALRFNNRSYHYVSKSLDAQKTWIVGFAYKTSPEETPYLYGEGILQFLWGSGVQCSLEYSTNRKLEFFRGTNTARLAEGTTVLDPDTWYYLELKVTIDNTNGSYELRVNGQTHFSGSGVDTQDESSDIADVIRFGYGISTIDDVYILDTATGLNGLLGACKVEAAFPTADVGTPGWTPSSGPTHYDLLDELSPSLSDYVSATGSGDEDWFEVGDTSGTGDIKGIQLNVDAAVDGPGARSLIFGVDSGGTQQTQGGAVGSQSGEVKTLILEEDPATGTAWTHAAANLLQVGIESG